MPPSVSLLTLGVSDVQRSVRFYGEGFGWTPVYEAEQIAFFQMNGFVLALYARDALAEDSGQAGPGTPGAFSIAHNVPRPDAVAPTMTRLLGAGAVLLREASEPPHGGLRGYVADPDGHIWEIAWHPAFEISPEGHVRFAG